MLAAADEPEDVIEYRQQVMKSQGAHITAIVAAVEGRVSFIDHIPAHAMAISVTAKMIPDIFPEGSGVGETRARPEIWQDWDKFTAAAEKLVQASAEMAEIAKGGDIGAIGAQLEEIGNACGGCHKPFRKKKE